MSENENKVAVIVITYNGKHNLKECFGSLKNQTYKNFDCYLLDNASTDGSTEYVREDFPWVKIIRLEKNYGFAEGYNRAVKKVSAEYVAFLNDDTRVDPEWLEELVKAIENDESLFAVGSKMLFYDKPDTINHAGAKITIIGAGIDVGFGEKDSPEFNKQKYVGAVCGGAMLSRRKIFEELGGFDKDYFAYFEDLDLCWRAWLMGYKVLYVPTSIVYHKFGGSWGERDSPMRIYYCQKNKIANIIKNFEISNIIFKSIPITLVYETVRVLMFMKDRKIENIKAIISGTIDAMKDIPTLLKKRKEIQKMRKLRDRDIYKMGLIATLWESISEFKRLDGQV